jgi:glucokinase
MPRDPHPLIDLPRPANATAAGLLPSLARDEIVKIAGGRARKGNVAMLYLGDAVIFSAARLLANRALAVPIAAPGFIPYCIPLAQGRDEVLARYLERHQLDAGAHRLLGTGGIALIYAALADASGEYRPALPAADIIRLALGSRCLLSIEALERYCEMVGCAAADVAISADAIGGVYLAGPTAYLLRNFIGETRFRTMFERRHASCMAIPSYIVRPRARVV